MGSGPFPSEQENVTGEMLRKKGHEFGATTGRPRRCGWLDLVALKYACMLNGVTSLLMTKADVLTGFNKIKVCTAYKNSGSPASQFPYEINEDIKPSYAELPGWQKDPGQLREFNDLPANLKDYTSYIEKELNIPIDIISVGPDRSETILRF